ncbi:MAG: Fic family protein [bacterium]
MFSPKYSISNKLLENIKKIAEIRTNLNGKKLPRLVYMEMWRAAQDLSTHASTSIEGNPLPLTEVKKLIKGKPENVRDSELEVLNYNQALIELEMEAKTGALTIDFPLVLKVQKVVTSGLLSKSDNGHLRKRAVVVNDPKTRQIAFIPPDFGDVPQLLQDLIAYIKLNRGELDSLILAGIFHKQMVLIHPFMDGNGRTTRLLTKVLLSDLGMNTFNLFSFENYYNQNVTKYFATVGEYGDYYEIADNTDFTFWLEYFTDGIVDELSRIQKLLDMLISNDRLEDYHQLILNYLTAHGRICDKEYVKLTKRADSTRIMDFRNLVDLGLIERKSGGPTTYYVLNETHAIKNARKEYAA